MSFLENLICKNVRPDRDQLAQQLISTQLQLKAAQDTVFQAQQETAARQNLLGACENRVKLLLDSSDKDKKELLTSLDSTNKALADATSENSALKSVIQTLKDNKQTVGILDLFPQESRSKIASYYTKYPFADITYAGRTVPNNPDKPFSCSLQAYLQAGIGTPEAKNVVKAANAYVVDVAKEKNLANYHRASDISLARVKSYVGRMYYKYQYDQDTVKVGEFWRFFVEVLKAREKYGIGDDCDGWAVVIYVLARTAGVPKECIRFVGGIARNSEGHATNNYFASDLRWRHLNSTNAYSSEFDVLDCPLLDDSKDQLGINKQDIWFSADEENAWSTAPIQLGSRPQEHPSHQRRKLPKILHNIEIRMRC